MSDLNEKELQTIISSAVNSNARVLSHKIEPFSEIKQGMMGSHFVLSIDVHEDSELATYTFFLKKRAETNILGNSSLEKFIFDCEVNFFNELQPLMIEHYNGPKWSAKCHFSKSGCLVFDDLRAQGYAMSPGLEMDLKTVESSIASLARFHACSILGEAKLGKPWLQVYPDLLKEKMYDKSSDIWKFIEIGYDTMALMAKKLNLNPAKVPDIFDHVYEVAKPKEGSVNVVRHSDLWKNNMMFKGDENLECVLVDFQALQYSSFACDLSMLIYQNTTVKLRKDSEVDMILSYYLAFRETLEKSTVQVNVPSYESMYEEYQKHRLFGMASGAMVLPVLMYPGGVEELFSNPDNFSKYMFGDRMGLIEPVLDSDTNYAKKMRDMLEELLDHADQVLK